MSRQTVEVDAGDLMEACQAANAWAGYLRRDAEASARVLGPDNTSAQVIVKAHNETADRIDQAVARLGRDGLGGV